jgi:hypothetical protein
VSVLSGAVNIIGKEGVVARLTAAPLNIMIQNRVMVTEMLDTVRDVLIPETPIGPGHFGRHLRDSYTVDVKTKGFSAVIGVLKAPVQGYWRERGTKRGQPGLMLAHKAANQVRRFIRTYYTGAAMWYRR